MRDKEELIEENFLKVTFIESDHYMFITDLDLNGDWVEKIQHICDIDSDNTLSWRQVSNMTGIRNIGEFFDSNYINWSNSLIEKYSNVVLALSSELENQKNLTKGNIHDLFDWISLSLKETTKFFCSEDEDGTLIYCKTDSKISVLDGYADSIFEYIPQESDADIKKGKYLCFLVEDEISETYKRKLEEAYKDIKEREKINEILVYDRLLRYPKGELSKALTEACKDNSGPNYELYCDILSKINSGYLLKEFAFLDLVLKEIHEFDNTPGYFSAVSKKDDKTGNIHMYITVKQTSFILSFYLSKKFTPSKIRNLYHNDEIQGTNLGQIYINVESILFYIERTLNGKNINMGDVYSKLVKGSCKEILYNCGRLDHQTGRIFKPERPQYP